MQRALGLVALLVLTVSVAAEAPNARSPLAINLAGIADWSTELVFVDAFKQSRAWISQEKGKVLNMRGKVFLGDDKENSMEIKPSARGFVWEGWNIEKDSDQMEFNMGRNIAKNWYLCFSTPIENIDTFPPLNQPPRPDSSEKAELQYRLDEERRLKLHWKDKEEFIGLEQRFRF